MKNILFTKLIEGSTTIDGMSAGEFTDMWGRVVAFKKDEMKEYLANTQKAIAATVDGTGELVGFPIDAEGHEHGEAAGWIKGASLAEGRDVIQFDVEWNELGKNSIAQKLFRYFSPEIDQKAKVVMGGSLTNYPAMRTKEHQILLKPVTLSMFSLDGASIDERLETIRQSFMDTYAEWDWSTYPVEVFESYLICWHDNKYWQVGYQEGDEGALTFDPMDQWTEVKRTWIEAALEKFGRVLAGFAKKPAKTGEENPHMEDDMTVELENLSDEQKDVLLAQAREQVVMEMTTSEPSAELAAFITAEAEKRFNAALALEKRKTHVAEFAARVVGGTAEIPHGLPVVKDELETLMLSLDESQQEAIEKILGAIHEKGTVSFEELGHSKRMEGNRELPAEIKVLLQKWVSEENTVEAFFTANAAELGDMSEYNLAEFIKE